MMGFSRNAGRQVAAEIETRTAHIVDRDIAAQGRIIFIPFQDIAEVPDTASRQRLDRTSRDGVHPDIVRAQIIGEIFDAGFEGSLGHAHHVIMRNDLFGTIIAQCYNAAAVRHHRRRPLRHRDKRIGGNIHRHQEIFETGIDIFAA